MITAAIVGASGYSGHELLRLLARRADVRIAGVFARASAGERVDALYPAVTGTVDLTYAPFDPEALRGVDVAFVALPSGEAMSAVAALQGVAGRIIDLSGDHRLQDLDVYARTYGHAHVAPALVEKAVYGLPELHRDRIAGATLVANPGCYPTSALLALIPALAEGLVEPTSIGIASFSGVSGAGRSAKVEMSFAELDGNIRAYKVGVHQHTPEIESVLSGVAGAPVTVSFVPHLVPLTRGIHTTVHARLARRVDRAEVESVYRRYYAGAPFVRLRSKPPELRGVVHTNYCDLAPFVDARSGQLVILSVIDNLLKGAAGQAVQNMNIMLGLPEETGLQ
jgi:N-acetyl-gamma-glutamyl-phosphate reductase